MKYLISAIFVCNAIIVLLLNNTAEVRYELRDIRIAGAGNRVIPVYLATQYLGPLRGIMINSLWLRYDEARKADMFYDSKEIIETLLVLQPKNENIWQFLAHEMILNIPAVLPKAEKWQWEKSGFLKLFEGMSTLAESVYLKFCMMNYLLKKSMPDDGKFNMEFIDRVTSDNEIVQTLPPAGETSPILKAAYMAKSCFDDLKKRPSEELVTSSGVILQAYSMLNYLHRLYMLEAFRLEEAVQYKAAQGMLDKALDTLNYFTHNYPTYATYHDNLKSAVEALKDIFNNESGSTDTKFELYKDFLKKYPFSDHMFFHRRLSRHLKTTTEDKYEFNDSEFYAVIPIEGVKVDTMLYDENDTDVFAIFVKDMNRSKLDVEIDNATDAILGASLLSSKLFGASPTLMRQMSISKGVSKFIVEVEPYTRYFIKIYNLKKDVKIIRYSFLYQSK